MSEHPKLLRWGVVMAALALPFTLTLTLTACASEPGTPAAPAASEVPQPEAPEEEAAPEPEPRTQEESCGWDGAAPLEGMPTQIADGQQGTLQEVIIGTWQHTHFDTGSGYEAVEHDIRYVFPSSTRLLYCQHVPGVTDHAENAADFTWDGTRIALPGGAPGFTVTEWNDDTMLWLNHADNSTYLLQRR